MIIVQLDENKYFTGSYAKVGSIQNGVEVYDLPEDLSNHKTTCWKYDKQIGNWVFDEDKYEKVLKEIESYVPPKTQKEINLELMNKNDELEKVLDELMTEVIPGIIASL